MRKPKGLSGDEAALWARVAATVEPMERDPLPPSRSPSVACGSGEGLGAGAILRAQGRRVARGLTPLRPGSELPSLVAPPLKDRGLRSANTLDATWDRRLGKGEVSPDFTLDLHGHSLDAAWGRLDHGLTLAQQQGARLVLVITGKPRAVEAADRGRQRGAIRAKLMDWLASGSHAAKIAAVRGAHPRHGGAGAVYVVLRKAR